MERESWIMESKKNKTGGDTEKDLNQARPGPSIAPGPPDGEIPPDDDDLYSRPTRVVAPATGSSGALFLGGPVSDSEEESFPDDDELDTLMGEMAAAGAAGVAAIGTTVIAAHSADKEKGVPKVTPVAPPVDEFADEMEAMAELGVDW